MIPPYIFKKDLLISLANNKITPAEFRQQLSDYATEYIKYVVKILSSGLNNRAALMLMKTHPHEAAKLESDMFDRVLSLPQDCDIEMYSNAVNACRLEFIEYLMRKYPLNYWYYALRANARPAN